MTRVAGRTPDEAATGLFFLNLCMLSAFLTWGVVTPGLSRRGLSAHNLMVAGLPLGLVILAWNVFAPQPVGAWEWAAWCVASTFINLSQPAIGQAFPQQQAGRALLWDKEPLSVEDQRRAKLAKLKQRAYVYSNDEF